MTCTCPKCHAQIDLELPEVTEAGTSAICPACKAKFNVYRESFGGRALHKSTELICAPCGSELGPQLHCPTCGAKFPDYLVVSLGRKRVRKASKKLKLSVSPFKPAKTTTYIPSLEASLKPDVGKTKPLASAGSKKSVILMITLILVVALSAGGAVFYSQYKTDRAYIKSFVLATYCLQTGIDRGVKSRGRIATEWKQKMEAGQTYVPRASIEDDRGFSLVDRKLDPAVRGLANPPEKFAPFNDRVTKLQNIYNKQRSLVSAPGNSLPGFLDAGSKLDAEYQQVVKSYKSDLPEPIMKELVSASLKFKEMRPLVQ